MRSKKEIFSELKEQLAECVNRYSGLFGEYRISNDDDYLLVTIEQFKNGIFVNGDFEKECYFSGNVEVFETGFYMPFDKYFDHIDHYLEEISQEITEGYLIPNNLYQFGE